MNNMDTDNKNMEKRNYFPPFIEKIRLDNEISLALESLPPAGPDEGAYLSPDFSDRNPLKCKLG